ncbi:phage tail assembly chaperone [Methylorubrum suomiense]|uniref:CRISPR type III-B/RAMP module-associated protein Cmr5 n=1 Tax=Methylorubrum suomiense TaxID=144191 RepID=A0ABQ4UZJ4_9HYPH|nr:hypothetical protein [Methylorubrum suomiense]GJE77249.1 hypothetical protein BGCPKDLD_3852 [Methylorubrum suomiense]
MAAERKINGNLYRSDMLPAEQGLELFLRVTKVFKAAPELMGALAAGKSDQDAPGRFMALVFSDDLDRQETGELLKDLVRTCQYKAPSAGYEECIIGIRPEKLAEVVKVAWFAMEVQFKDFLSESLELKA